MLTSLDALARTTKLMPCVSTTWISLSWSFALSSDQPKYKFNGSPVRKYFRTCSHTSCVSAAVPILNTKFCQS